MDLEEREREKAKIVIKSNCETFVLKHCLLASYVLCARDTLAQKATEKIPRSFLSRSLALIHRTDLALNDLSLVSIFLICAIIIFITAIRRVFPSCSLYLASPLPHNFRFTIFNWQ